MARDTLKSLRARIAELETELASLRSTKPAPVKTAMRPTRAALNDDAYNAYLASMKEAAIASGRWVRVKSRAQFYAS